MSRKVLMGLPRLPEAFSYGLVEKVIELPERLILD